MTAIITTAGHHQRHRAELSDDMFTATFYLAYGDASRCSPSRRSRALLRHPSVAS
jgi:hypothetical protein